MSEDYLKNGRSLREGGYICTPYMLGMSKKDLIEEILGTHGHDYLIENGFIKKLQKCCSREECEWLDGVGENDHSCPGFVKSAIVAQMEDLDSKKRQEILEELRKEEVTGWSRLKEN